MKLWGDTRRNWFKIYLGLHDLCISDADEKLMAQSISTEYNMLPIGPTPLPLEAPYSLLVVDYHQADCAAPFVFSGKKTLIYIIGPPCKWTCDQVTPKWILMESCARYSYLIQFPTRSSLTMPRRRRGSGFLLPLGRARGRCLRILQNNKSKTRYAIKTLPSLSVNERLISDCKP